MLRIATALLVLLGSWTCGWADEIWPTRTVTIIAPYPPGTAPDAIARFVAEQLTAKLKQPVVVENRTGAGGLIGTEAAAKAANDGYTLFLGSLDTQAVLGHLHRLKFDPVKDFAPISLLGRIYNMISASPKLKENTIQALIADGKKGKSYTFGSPGIGTNLHLLGEVFKLRTGVNLVHVPYRNIGIGITDAMNGRLDLVITGLPPVIGLIKEHKLTPLVITAPHRLKALPDTPTMAEIGHKDLTITGWFGLLAPAGTSSKIIDKLNADVQAMTQNTGYRAKMEQLMIDPVSTTPAEFARLIKSDSARMGDIIKRAHIKVH
jgi:tripartite-type tricarboxylate transporter receptor subunit TctC